jgi:hypothetical protein
MPTRLTRLCLVLLLATLALPAGAADDTTPARGDRLPPCPPRQAGQPPPTDCANPCPKGMVGNHPNCSCPPGTVKAERPRSPSEYCVAVKYKTPPVIQEQPGTKFKDLIKQCPEGHVGTYPDCHCPPGLTGPKCDQVLVR